MDGWDAPAEILLLNAEGLCRCSWTANTAEG